MHMLRKKRSKKKRHEEPIKYTSTVFTVNNTEQKPTPACLLGLPTEVETNAGIPMSQTPKLNPAERPIWKVLPGPAHLGKQ